MTELAKTTAGRTLVELALKKANAVGVDELTADHAEKLIADIMKSTTPPADAAPKQAPEAGQTSADVPANVATWLDTHAAAVNAYLIRVNWVAAGQTWRNLADDKRALIATKPEKFARAAGVPVLA